MSYKSLNPSNHDSSGESDESIQGSPLLNTSARFGEAILESPSSVYERSNVSHGEHLSYADPVQRSSPPRSGEGDRIDYLRGLQGSPSRLHGQVVEGSAGQLLREPRSHTSMKTSLEAVDLESVVGTSSDQIDKVSPLGATLARSSMQRGDRRSMPPRLSLMSQQSQSDSHTLNFNTTHQRPNSMFIKKSFEPEKSIGSERPDDDEDDILPFSTTKQMAWSGRPQSMMNLSHSGGQIMSKETFDNYRKSISSLGMLKNMSSTGSFRSEKSSHRRENADGDSIDEEDVKSLGSSEESEYPEKEEHSHEQERKRASAKVRQQQDARMSVYRQSMKKVVGGSADSTINLDHSTANIGAESGYANPEDEDSDSEDLMDDIPLSILQAHRFPRSRRKSPSLASTNRLSNSLPSGSPNPRTQSISPKLASTSRMSMLSQSSAALDSGSPALANHDLRGASYPELPSVFGNNSGNGTRGLINVIAEEEELRKRRHTFGYGSTIAQGSPRTESLADAPKHSMYPKPNKDDLQTKLDQVLSLLSTLAPSPATSSTLGPNSPALHPGSSWNLSAQMHQRAPSIHSAYSARSAHFRDSYGGHPSAVYGAFAQDFSPQTINGGTSPMPQMHPDPSFFPRQQSFIPATPIQPSMLRGSQTYTRPASNRPSRMRVVENSKEEEEDDEAEWQKLMEQRKALREQWKSTEEIPSV